MKALPDMVAPLAAAALPRRSGTDGFGRSDTRENLRALLRDRPAAHRGRDAGRARPLRRDAGREGGRKAIRELGIDPDKTDPLTP